MSGVSSEEGSGVYTAAAAATATAAAAATTAAAAVRRRLFRAVGVFVLRKSRHARIAHRFARCDAGRSEAS